MTLKRKLGIAAVLLVILATGLVSAFWKREPRLVATFLRYEGSDNATRAVLQLENQSGTELYYWCSAIASALPPHEPHALIPFVSHGTLSHRETLEVSVLIAQPPAGPNITVLWVRPSKLRRLLRTVGMIHTADERWPVDVNLPARITL
jgi:hypothetical protein